MHEHHLQMYSAPLLADISSHGRDSHSDTFSFCEYTTTLFHQKVKIAVFGKRRDYRTQGIHAMRGTEPFDPQGGSSWAAGINRTRSAGVKKTIGKVKNRIRNTFSTRTRKSKGKGKHASPMKRGQPLHQRRSTKPSSFVEKSKEQNETTRKK